eukprot:scaffold62759_cov36-Phaeocystis_antarctica.AAC.2
MALARLTERAVAAAKVAVAADSTVGSLLAWRTEDVGGKVGATKARFLSKARTSSQAALPTSTPRHHTATVTLSPAGPASDR